MRRYLLLLAMIGYPLLLTAQFTSTINNLTKYAYGDNYTHRENLFDIHLYRGSWNASMEFEISNPPQFGTPLTGINRLRIEWISEHFEVKFGHVYPLWNRGLVMNLRYERELGYDSGLIGLETEYELKDGISLFAVGGLQEFDLSSPSHADLRTHDWTENRRIVGIGARTLDFGSIGELSVDIVYADAARPYHSLAQQENTFQPITSYYNTDETTAEIFWNKRFSQGDVVINHAIYNSVLGEPWSPTSSKQMDQKFTGSMGFAHYSALSGMVLNGMGFTLEYKNYAYDIRPPGIWQDIYKNWPTRMSPLQRPPIGYREQSETLIGRLTRTTNYNDEIGFQFELNHSLTNGLFWTGNVSVASRHHSYEIFNNQYQINQKRNLLPSLNNAFFPNFQSHIEIEKPILNNTFYVKQAINYLRFVDEYSKRIILEGDQTSVHSSFTAKNALTSLTKIDMTFGSGHSIALYFESQWLEREFHVKKVKRTNTIDMDVSENLNVLPIYNRLITLSVRQGRGITFSLMYDYATQTETGTAFNINPEADNPIEGLLRNLGIDLKNKWIGIGLVVDMIPHSQLTLFYGSEQGGLRCANGVCQEIPPFEDGFRLSLQTYF